MDFFIRLDEIIEILLVPVCIAVTYEKLDLCSFLMTELVFLY